MCYLVLAISDYSIALVYFYALQPYETPCTTYVLKVKTKNKMKESALRSCFCFASPRISELVCKKWEEDELAFLAKEVFLLSQIDFRLIRYKGNSIWSLCYYTQYPPFYPITSIHKKACLRKYPYGSCLLQLQEENTQTMELDFSFT